MTNIQERLNLRLDFGKVTARRSELVNSASDDWRTNVKNTLNSFLQEIQAEKDVGFRLDRWDESGQNPSLNIVVHKVIQKKQEWSKGSWFSKRRVTKTTFPRIGDRQFADIAKRVTDAFGFEGAGP